MIPDFNPSPRRAPARNGARGASVVSGDRRRTGRSAKPWHCPVPTLEGLPRLPAASKKPASALPPDHRPETVSLATREETLARRLRSETSRDDFLLRLYLRDMRREPRLRSDEETELGWQASFDDDSARQRLVLGNLRLVVHIALEYRHLGLPMADLINEGNLGLMRAAELFKPGFGRRFSHYAATWIRKRMRQALTTQAWLLRLPADFSWRHNRLRAAEARLSSDSGDPVPDADLAQASGLNLAAVRRLRGRGFPCALSLENPGSDSGDRPPLADLLVDERIQAPDQILGAADEREWLLSLLGALKPRERQVLRLRYGFEDGRERTLDEVGRILGYVRQGIHRIESSALAKLRRLATGPCPSAR